MLLDNKLITNRPKELFDIEHYTSLHEISMEFNYSALPEYLNIDLVVLFGIMPKTRDLIMNSQPVMVAKPSEREVEYYKRRNTNFQIVHVVANIHTFKNIGEKTVSAYPYSITLIAGPKRGKPDRCTIELLDNLDLERISNSSRIYTDYSPFKQVETGLYSDYSLISNSTHQYFTDTIGFVLETYFLPTDVDLDDVPMVSPRNISLEIGEKYRKYRVKRYFSPFLDIKPRKIWGCDSPIELFLIQGLAKQNLFPIIQTLIFKDGSIYDNFFKMIESTIFKKGDELITEVDLYFPHEKLAVFCDSTQFHRGNKKKEKDKFIDEQLRNLGIKSLRITGKEITENLISAVEKVCNAL